MFFSLHGRECFWENVLTEVSVTALAGITVESAALAERLLALSRPVPMFGDWWQMVLLSDLVYQGVMLLAISICLFILSNQQCTFDRSSQSIIFQHNMRKRERQRSSAHFGVVLERICPSGFLKYDRPLFCSMLLEKCIMKDDLREIHFAGINEDRHV